MYCGLGSCCDWVIGGWGELGMGVGWGDGVRIVVGGGGEGHMPASASCIHIILEGQSSSV